MYLSGVLGSWVPAQNELGYLGHVLLQKFDTRIQHDKISHKTQQTTVRKLWTKTITQFKNVKLVNDT